MTPFGRPCTGAAAVPGPRPVPTLPRLGLLRLLGLLLLGAAGASPAPLQAQSPPPPLVDRSAAPDSALVPGEATAAALADLAALEACVARPAGASGEGSGGGSGGPPAGARSLPPASAADAAQLQRLRSLYLLAVDDEPGLRRAWEAHGRLATSPWSRTRDGAAVLEGYRGALQALEAKHGFWPPSRVRDLRQGLGTLDAQVEATPSQEEVRYLRLLSTAFLPGILGRRGSAEADLRALALLLPPAAERYPMRTWVSMADAVEALLRDNEPELARETAAAFAQARDRARMAAIPLAPGCHVQ